MTYFHLLEKFPEPLRAPLADLVDAVQKDTREQLAVRREDFVVLRETVSELAQAQARTEQRVEELAQAQARTEQRVQELVEAQKHNESHFKRLDDKMSRVEGWALEHEYRAKVSGYFGSVLRKARVASQSDLEDTLRARLSADQVVDVFRLDLLVTGIVSQGPAELVNTPLWLAVQVSATIDRQDVTRAARRAAALREAGYACIPVVAGLSLTDGAVDEIQNLAVAALTDGQMAHWENALRQWGAAPASDSPPA